MPQDENKIRLADALANAEVTTESEGYIPIITGESEPHNLKKFEASFIDEISEIKNDVENLESEFDTKADKSDLNNYYTKSDIDSGFVTFGQLEEKLSDYYTSGQIEEKISEFLTSADLDDYVTGSDLTNILSDYVTNSELDSTLSDYVTEEELNNILSDYVTQSDLDEVMDVVFGNLSDLEETKADKSELDNYETIDSHNEDIADLQEQIDELGSGIARVMRYKGTVYDYDELPTIDNEIGDVWNVEENDYNYAWNGSDWDRLSPIIDISEKADKTELNALADDLHNNYYDSDTIDTMLSTKADESELDNYVTSDVYNSGINDLQEQIDNLSSDIDLLSDALDNYVTKEHLSDNYYDSDTIDNMLSMKADKSELSDYVTSDKLNDYYTSGEIDELLSDIDLSDYAKQSDLDELENVVSDLDEQINGSDGLAEQIEDLKTSIVTIANGDSSISNNVCSLTLSNNTIYDITATGLTSIVITTTTGTLDFISQLNFSTYNSSGIKPTLTLPSNSKIIDTNDCIDSISSNTITFITNYRITMICYYDGSQYRFVFQGA